ncbi:unnamed protein product, partial [Mesorhabditis belari]|uniref:Gustatory receptor n=1 Tax=Mesorhabditis belari TaxID=2138241 RepID=A0AAF3F1L8_9BILA
MVISSSVVAKLRIKPVYRKPENFKRLQSVFSATEVLLERTYHWTQFWSPLGRRFNASDDAISLAYDIAYTYIQPSIIVLSIPTTAIAAICTLTNDRLALPIRFWAAAESMIKCLNCLWLVAEIICLDYLNCVELSYKFKKEEKKLSRTERLLMLQMIVSSFQRLLNTIGWWVIEIPVSLLTDYKIFGLYDACQSVVYNYFFFYLLLSLITIFFLRKRDDESKITRVETAKPRRIPLGK